MAKTPEKRWNCLVRVCSRLGRIKTYLLQSLALSLVSIVGATMLNQSVPVELLVGDNRCPVVGGSWKGKSEELNESRRKREY
jgi:hypothetical protein